VSFAFLAVRFLTSGIKI
jgi:hypothetical protein